MSTGPIAPPLAIGSVVMAILPPQPAPMQAGPGGEQLGHRPAVILALPHCPGPARRPLLVIVPFTSDKGYRWARANPGLYPIVAAGVGSLTVDSVALIDQLRALDPARVTAIVGMLSAAELQPILDGLREMLAL